MSLLNPSFLAASLLSISLTALGQAPPAPKGYQEIGQLRTRSAKEINASTWSIGGETLDRDYTDYQSNRQFLWPLGA